MERYWFAEVFAGHETSDLYCTEAHPDGDHLGFDPLAEKASEKACQEVSALGNAVTTSRDIARADESLDEVPVRRLPVQPVTLRWIFLHLIGEYGRHERHDDLLRERLDGSTGE